MNNGVTSRWRHYKGSDYVDLERFDMHIEDHNSAKISLFAEDEGGCYDVEVSVRTELRIGYDKTKQTMTFDVYTAPGGVNVDVNKGFWCSLFSLLTFGIWQSIENDIERKYEGNVRELLDSNDFGDVAAAVVADATDSLGRLKRLM